MEEYVDKLWLQKGRSPWIRFKAGHNKESQNILHEDLTAWAKCEDYTVAKEKIQAKNLSKVGFLMAYHPNALNATNLELALQQFESLKDATKASKSPNLSHEVQQKLPPSGQAGNKQENVEVLLPRSTPYQTTVPIL